MAQDGLKEFFAAEQWQLPQVVAVQVKKVKDIVSELALAGLLIVLQELKARFARFIQHDHFPVQHGLVAELLERLDQRPKPLLERELVAGIEVHPLLPN